MARRHEADERHRHARPDISRHLALRTLLAVALLLAGGVVAGVAIYQSIRTPSSGDSAARSATGAATPSPTQPPGLWQRSLPVASSLLTPLPSLRPAAEMPAAAGLSAVLQPLLADPALVGDRVDVVVGDAVTGQVLFERGGADLVLPASTAKLAIAAAALRVLGADHRFTTRVVSGSVPSEIVLVGGGDPTLSGPKAVGGFAPGYPTPAKLSELARQTASALHAKGVAEVSVGYDATLFTGAATGPGWKPNYVTDGDVAPISALEVDEGRPDPGKTARTVDPAADAAAQFVALLTADGVTVTGKTRPIRAVGGQATLASTTSPPVADLVQRMLGRSDNDLAEALGRHVAIAAGLPATFAGGAQAVKTALIALGVDASGFSMVDSSGLSEADRVRPAALVQIVQLALGPTHPELAPMLAGLPVSAFSGTLHTRFAGVAAAAGGEVRAKTGTLDGVVALAGYLDDAVGRTLVFSIVANGVPLNATESTEAALDRVAAGLAACGCR